MRLPWRTPICPLLPRIGHLSFVGKAGEDGMALTPSSSRFTSELNWSSCSLWACEYSDSGEKGVMQIVKLKLWALCRHSNKKVQVSHQRIYIKPEIEVGSLACQSGAASNWTCTWVADPPSTGKQLRGSASFITLGSWVEGEKFLFMSSFQSECVQTPKYLIWAWLLRDLPLGPSCLRAGGRYWHHFRFLPLYLKPENLEPWLPQGGNGERRDLSQPSSRGKIPTDLVPGAVGGLRIELLLVTVYLMWNMLVW